MEKSPRLLYVDWIRGLAILIMLQGHAFHSWLRDDLRDFDLFQLSQMVGGFPGALFLFITGISLVLMLDGKQRGGAGPSELWRLVLRRSGYVLLMAFLFRIQLWAFYWPRSSAWDILKVDILTTIAMSLALSGMLVLLTPKRLGMMAAAAAATAAAMATPLVWALPPVLPDFLMAYVQGRPQTANFPLFPWISYAFTGVMVGLAVVGREKPETDRVMQWLVLGALTLLAAAKFFDSIPYSYYRPYDYWNTSPNLVANKTAVVLLLFAGCYGWTSVADPHRFSWVRQIGHTSLLIYWVHVELVYGRFLTFLQHRLSEGQTVAAVIVLTGAMLALSVVKTRWAQSRRAIRAPWTAARTLAKLGGGD